MAIASSNGIELFYDVVGDDDGVPLLLVMGLGAQYHLWDDDFAAGLADRGFRVVRFDNRDVGLSAKISAPHIKVADQIMVALGGGTPEAPYLLRDMAADAVGLLDHLGIAAAHVVGASMGGMIAQTIAIEFPERVLSLTSIMSTTGDSDVGQMQPEMASVLLAPPAADREAAVAQGIAGHKAIGSPDHFDEAKARLRAETSYDRCYHPTGVGHQMLAIIASGSRTERLRQLSVPTLVVHGVLDPLVDVSGGRRTAEVIPGAELLEIDDMGHDLPQVHWPQIIEGITALAGRVPA